MLQFLLVCLLINSEITFASDMTPSAKEEQNIFEGEGFKIVWNNENSGTIFYEPDAIFESPWEHPFENYELVQKSTTFHNSDRPPIVDSYMINQSCSHEQLNHFAKEMKTQKIGCMYEYRDKIYLFENRFLINGIDYKLKDDKTIFIGNTQLSLDNAIVRINSDSEPVYLDKKYRKLVVNDHVTMKTYSLQQKKRKRKSF